MDKMQDSDSCAEGSIPSKGAKFKSKFKKINSF